MAESSLQDQNLITFVGHRIILAALGQPIPTSAEPSELEARAAEAAAMNLGTPPPVISSAILEAEVVVYNEREERIDPFYFVNSCLKAGGELGALHEQEDDDHDLDEISSQSSLGSALPYSVPVRHLAVVFFDCLGINERHLLCGKSN